MSDRHFTLDTNILVYALDRQAGARHALASYIIDRATVSTNCWLTLQSISEFYAAATRKRLVPVTGVRDQALDWLSMFRIAAASASAVRTALDIAASGRASYWDALLVITAAEAGCTAILTEDLADDTTFAGVRVINPFAGTSLSAAAEALLALD
jgi:predicted nucleic acid-binding protein